MTIRVASGWRQLSEEERGELGDLGQDESIRFIAVGKAIEGYVPNIVITETEVFSGKGTRKSSTAALVAWLSLTWDAASLTTPSHRIPPRIPDWSQVCTPLTTHR